MATLFGLNPFQSEYDVWLEKTGQLEPGETVKPWLEAGNDFEPIILNKASRVLGKLQRSQYRSAKKLGLPLGANVDALAVDRGKRPVEAKTVGLFWPVDEAWGQEGTNEVPDRVNIQCHVHMITTDQDLYIDHHKKYCEGKYGTEANMRMNAVIWGGGAQVKKQALELLSVP